MKKIYMILAAMSLLTLSLNAQVANSAHKFKPVDKTQITELAKSQMNVSKGNTSSLQSKEEKRAESAPLMMKGKNGQMIMSRAPKRALNDGEYYVGPYTTDEFSNTGVGFGDWYTQAQSVNLTVSLNRSEFEEHIGDKIVGFRFALAGSGTVPVWDFNVRPYTISDNTINWDTDNQHIWTLGTMHGDGYVKVTSIDDITDDGEYLIVCENNNLAFNGALTTLDASGNTISVTPNNGRIEASDAANAAVFYIEQYNGYYYIQSASGYYIGWSATTSTGLNTAQSLTTNNQLRNFRNTISFDANGNASIKGYSEYYLRYNTASNALRFRYYSSATGQNIQIYKRIGSSVVFLNAGQWHEYRLDEPITFDVSSDTENMLIGYTFYQPLSSNTTYNTTPVAVNPNSTGHSHLALMYASSDGTNYQRAWWNLGDLGGDLAVQLIFESDLEKTATPTITVTPGAEYYTVTATGDGTVTLTVSGQTATGQGSASINVPVTPDDQALTATATAQEEGKRVSDPATQAVNIPGAGRTPMPTINYVWNGDECTITATGNGEVHMYVDGNEVTQPYVVEKGATQKTIVVTATAQEEGLAISNTATQSIVIPAMNTSDFTELDGTYTADQPIDMSKMMFCDRFSASTATNSHPYQYDYVMKENTGDKRSTNTVEVPVQHTGSKVMPYYSLDSVNADVDRHHVTPYVLNASQEIYMSPSSKIFFYTLQRGRAVNTIPTQYFSVMQRQPSGDYKEMQDPSTNFGQEVAPGDYYNCLDDGKRFTGDYDTHYMAYVPVVWTYGYDRVGYDPNNPVHNSYGAPIWKTGAPQVRTIYTEAQMQRGPNGSTQWEDANGNACSLYFLGVEAYGDVPSPNVTNIKCEPYMFRVWVESPSGKLRGYTYVPADPQRPVKPGAHWEGDGSALTGPICVYEGLTTDGHLYKHLQSMEEGNNQDWNEKIKFAAVDNIDDLEVYIRFYYKSEGEAIEANNTNGLRGNRDGGAGYGAGDGGGSPGISTSINGVYTDGNRGDVIETTYVNAQGMKSDKPFDGLNIVVTRYSDGTTRTTKVVR